jgi:hypothetical protein
MKKSIIELIRAKQKRKNKIPAFQRPGNEKPKYITFSLNPLKTGSSKMIFDF